jgi:hypothetical protein
MTNTQVRREEMLDLLLDAYDHYDSRSNVIDAIRALIESAPADITPQPNNTPLSGQGVISDPTPGKCEDLHGNSKVEEAMGRLTWCLNDLHRYEGQLDESPLMKEHRKKDIPGDLAALATLRAALQPKRVTRAWVEAIVRDNWPRYSQACWDDVDEICVSMLRELGVEVVDE